MPVPVRPVEVPPFYYQLAASPEEGVVLEWPFGLRRSRSLLYQTVHGRPMVGGYLSRPRVYPLRSLPPFREREYPDRDITTADPAAAGRAALRLAGVRWIVVLLDDYQLDRERLPGFLARYAEPEPLYADAQTAVYRPRPPADVTFFVGVEGGWHDPELLPDRSTLMRWLSGAADLTAWNLTSTAQTGELRFEAWSFFQPRRLEVSVDGRVVGEWTVGERRTYTLPLTLEPGQHRVQVRSLDPPSVPAALTGGSDTRPLAIGVANVELQPRP